MKMDFFTRTYRGDSQWLSYLMRSIPKFCSGYNEFVVVCPKSDRDIIYQVTRPYDVRLEATEDDIGRGYLEQQYSKMIADTFCEGDYIGFVDSDCMFVLPNTPDSWFENGKIRYLVTPYAELGNAVPWRKFTEAALGFECPFETMRRHPCVFPRGVIANCRTYMVLRHHKPLRNYILEQGGNSFSEFNVMGSYALQVEPDRFQFIDTTESPLPPKIVEQRWSYGGLTDKIKAENERILSCCVLGKC